MSRHPRGRAHPERGHRAALGAGALVIALTLAACGSGTTSKTGGTSPSSGATDSTTSPPVSKTLGVGVTAKTIKVGISNINFSCIEAYTDSIRVNERAVYQAYIDNINQNGGINGRKIVPVYRTYCPPPITTQILSVCTSFTDDDNVFAVIGTYYDTSGDAQTCVAGQHHRVLLTFDVTQAIMDKSPAGLIVTPAANPERYVRVLLELLKKQGTLKGKTVAVLGDTTLQSTVNGTIIPGLKKLGVKLAATALLSITGSDTAAAQSQLGSFIERWKTEGVDTVFLSSYEVSSQQFVSKLRKEMPNILLLSDNGQALSYGQQLKRSGVNPNPYAGLITANGPTPKEYGQSANWTYCKTIYQKETGKVAPGPLDVVPYKNGKTLDTYGAINDSCQLLTMFHDIAERVGPYLNNDNWIRTVNTFGHIENRGTGPYSSLHAGKYDADDNFRLVEFDPTLPPDGNWKPLTPLQDITG